MAPSAQPRDVQLIGWKEYVDLPELGVSGLKAKVDTGARTSALHVDALSIGDRRPDGTAEVSFEVPLDRKRPERRVRARARMLGEVKITDSGGTTEVRPVIETELVLGPVRKRILLTLTNRTGMLFRMLLGRKTLEGEFIVDVARKYVAGGRPARRAKTEPAAAAGREVP
jgi:hypothetical protein